MLFVDRLCRLIRRDEPQTLLNGITQICISIRDETYILFCILFLIKEVHFNKVKLKFIGRSGSNSSAFYLYGAKPHPLLVRMCMHQGAELLYGNVHTLR